MVKNRQIYVVIGTAVLLVALFVSAPYFSNAPAANLAQATVCQPVNFSVSSPNNVAAPIGTNTFINLIVNNTGKSTYTLSLSAAKSAGAPFTLQTAKAIVQSPGQNNYTQIGVYSPTILGNYSVSVNVTAQYANCAVKSRLLTVGIRVVNGTAAKNGSV